MIEEPQVKVFALKTIVEEVKDETQEILLEDARRIDLKYQLGDVVEIEVTPRNFGRIAAQNAKQVVVQRIREAERVITYEKFIEKENEIMPCMVQRVERKNVYVDLDQAEGLMLMLNTSEEYKVNDRLIVYSRSKTPIKARRYYIQDSSYLVKRPEREGLKLSGELQKYCPRGRSNRCLFMPIIPALIL